MKGTKGFVFLWLVSMGGLIACNRLPDNDRIWQAADLARVFPDSAAAIIEEEISPDALTGEDLADYWFVRTLVHLNQKRGLVNDSMIVFAVDYYRRDSSFFYKSSRYYNACKFAAWQNEWSANDQRRQEFFLWEALENARLRKDSFCMEEAYSLLADFYFEKKEYRKSIEMCRGLALFPDEPRAEAWYTTALCYSRMGNDSATVYFSKATELAYAIGSRQAYHYMRNYGDYLSSADPEAAVAYFRRLEELFPESSHAYAFAELFLQLGKKDSMAYYLSELEKEISDEDEWYLTRRIHARALRIAYQARFGLPVGFGSLGIYCDSISFAIINKVRNEEERVWMQQKLVQDNWAIETSRQRTLAILFALLFVCTAAASLFFFYIRSRRARWVEAEEKLEALQQLYREATAETVSDVPETVRAEEPGNAFFRKILLQQLGMIRLVANTPTQQNQELLQQMARIANEDVPADSLLVWDDLYPVIDSVYKGFYARLTRFAASRLSEKEIQLCCLLCAGFSTKEISVVTRQSVRTVYQRKTNIRHALEMDEKDDIVAFIDRATA